MARYIGQWAVWIVWFVVWNTVFRVSRPTRMWLLVASVWAPVAYLVIIAFLIGEFGNGTSAFRIAWHFVALPMIVIWVGTVLLHCSLLALWRYAQAAAILMGPMSICLTMVAIAGLTALPGDACPDASEASMAFGICADFQALPPYALVAYALVVDGIMLILSMPSWTVVGIIRTTRFIRRKLHTHQTNGD